MKINNKRAQETFGISFGVIFSIFLIIFIVSVAFYAIDHFLKLNKCSQVGMFFNDLEDEIDSAWNSNGEVQQSYVGKLPSKGLLKTGAQKVCFGNLTQPSYRDCQEIQRELKDDYVAPETHNVFIYPPKEVCGGEFFSYKLKHLDTSQVPFFCVAVKDNKVSIKIKKSQSDILVKVEPATNPECSL